MIFLFIFSCLQTHAENPYPPIERPPIFLGIGEQRLLHLHKLKRFSLGQPIVKAIPLAQHKNRILIKGLQKGNTDLWVWKSDQTTEYRTIHVAKVTSQEIPISLLKALSRLNETEVIYSGSTVILKGEVQTLSESAKIEAIAKSFSKDLINETRLSDNLLIQGQNQLEKWLEHSSYKNSLRLERISRTLWLRGGIHNPTEKSHLEKEVKHIFPATQLEINSLPDHSPTIHFKVYLLELKKNQFSALGLRWPEFQEGAFRVTSAAIQDFLQLNLTLSELEGEGSAHILSTPELVVRAPGDAEVFAGGELPIHIQKAHYENVIWKPFGLKLKLKVTHIAGSSVRLDIFAEVSHLDHNIGVDKIPGIQSSRMKTQVDAKMGTPLLLTGLLQSGTREQAKGLPLLRNIPILGALFGSEDYLKERSELVAILLPSTTLPQAPMHKFQSSDFPRGPVPPPRDWISLKRVQALKKSENYPWNVFE